MHPSQPQPGKLTLARSLRNTLGLSFPICAESGCTQDAAPEAVRPSHCDMPGQTEAESRVWTSEDRDPPPSAYAGSRQGGRATLHAPAGGLVLPKSQACHTANCKRHLPGSWAFLLCQRQPGPGGGRGRWAEGARNVAEAWGACDRDRGHLLCPRAQSRVVPSAGQRWGGAAWRGGAPGVPQPRLCTELRTGRLPGGCLSTRHT